MFIQSVVADPRGRLTRNPRRYRWLMVLLLIGMLLGAVPAAAAVIVINPEAPPPALLAPAELQKLAALRHTYALSLASDVSPDDGAVVAVGFPESDFSDTPYTAFVDIDDGTSTPIDLAILSTPPMTDIVWRDARTAVYVSLDPSTQSPLLVTLSRDTGALTTEPLALPGFPLSIAPNGSRLLIYVPPSEEPPASVEGGHRRPVLRERRPGFEQWQSARLAAAPRGVPTASSGESLAAFDLATQEVLPLVTMPPGTFTLTGHPGSSGWTPDGSKLAVVRTTLTPPGPDDPDPSVQDALGRLPPHRNPFFPGNVVDVFDFETGEMRPAALAAAGGDGVVFNQVAWSPDGRTLVAQVRRPSTLAGRRYPIYQQPDRSALRFYDAQLDHIGTLERPEINAPSIHSPLWLSDGELIIRAPDGLSERLYLYRLASGRFRKLATEDGAFGLEAPDVRVTHASREVIAIHSSFQRPSEVYRIAVADGSMDALTDLNATAAAANEVRVDRVSFRLTESVTRTGYLIQPATASFPPRDVPIVVYQQGGPGLAMTNRWGATAEEPFNLLPNFGIAVLFMPFSGREGFGPEFYNALFDGRNFGQIDIREAAQAVQFMLAQGYTSRGRVGITGCSYGGYFAGQSITRYPGLYAAANAQCSLLDMFSSWEGPFNAATSYWEGRLPAAAPAEYTKDSPLYQAEKVKTPLLLFHGADDRLAPVALAEEFHNRIEATGTPVELLIFEGEGHGLSAPNSHSTAAQWQIVWFRKYLKVPQSIAVPYVAR